MPHPDTKLARHVRSRYTDISSRCLTISIHITCTGTQLGIFWWSRDQIPNWFLLPIPFSVARALKESKLEILESQSQTLNREFKQYENEHQVFDAMPIAWLDVSKLELKGGSNRTAELNQPFKLKVQIGPSFHTKMIQLPN